MIFIHQDRLKAVALTAFLFCFVTSAARAQQPGTPSGQTIQQACAADLHQFCSGIQPGGGRIVACLQQNSARLSQGCQQALAAAKSTRQGSADGSSRN